MRITAALSSLLAVLLAAPAECAGQSFAGRGQQASSLFPLGAGLVVFELEHTGEGRFVVRLLDGDGAAVDTLANAIGGFRGSKAVRVPQAGEYLLDVAATGEWRIGVRNGGTTATAAAAGAAEEVVGEERLRSHGRYGGQQAANEASRGGYLFGGLLGGVVAGPLGAGAAFLVTSGRKVDVPAELELSVAERDPAYRDAFLDAYRVRLRSNRRTASLVGGVTGTAVFAFLVAQAVNWSGGTGGEGGGPPGGGEP